MNGLESKVYNIISFFHSLSSNTSKNKKEKNEEEEGLGEEKKSPNKIAN